MIEQNTLPTSALITILVIALFAMIVGPLIFIWSLNTLFKLTIAYEFYEWLAALIILGFLKTYSFKAKKSS